MKGRRKAYRQSSGPYHWSMLESVSRIVQLPCREVGYPTLFRQRASQKRHQRVLIGLHLLALPAFHSRSSSKLSFSQGSSRFRFQDCGCEMIFMVTLLKDQKLRYGEQLHVEGIGTRTPTCLTSSQQRILWLDGRESARNASCPLSLPECRSVVDCL